MSQPGRHHPLHEQHQSFEKHSPTEQSSNRHFNPQFPTSPPLSSAASQVDSVTSPQPSAFTPPTSVPMSAEHSNRSFASAPHNGDDDPAEPTDTLMSDARDDQGSLSPNSAKRKALDDRNQAVPNKQMRMDTADTESKRHSSVKPYLITPLKPCTPMRIPPSTDMIKAFGLDSLASTVARKDLVTGEKINKLRKSYENHIKDFPGRNKPTSNPGEFSNLLRIPQEEWESQHVKGKEIPDEIDDEMMDLIKRATTLYPGALPAEENKNWRAILKMDDSSRTVGNPAFSQSTNKAGVGRYSAPQSNAPSPAATAPPRPSRRGVKRSYHDDSFEGYTETFVDEQGDANTAMDLDDEDDGRGGGGGGGSLKKKRKKVGSAFSSPAHSPIRSSSAGKRPGR